MQSIPADPILKFNPTTLEDIRKCWNLEDGRMEQSVNILEEWMTKQNHFVNKSFRRDYLERTLIVCKGSVEKAKSQIDKLCTLKTLLPKFFFAGDVKKYFGEVAEIAWLIPLPKLTKDNYRIFMFRLNPKGFTAADYMSYYQLCVVICEYIKAHDYTNGFILIKDFRAVNLLDIMTSINFVEFQQFVTILIMLDSSNYLLNTNTAETLRNIITNSLEFSSLSQMRDVMEKDTNLKKIVDQFENTYELIVEGFGARLKNIHILTQSKVIDVFVKTFKPMLSAKIGDRINVVRDLEELHSVVDKDLLPMDYGGEERSIEKLKSEFLEELSSEEHEKYLIEMKASCTDETLRTSEKFNEQIMGLPGSFRTLNVD